MTMPLRRAGCTKDNPCKRTDCDVCETQVMFGRMFGRRTGDDEGLNFPHREQGPGEDPKEGGVVSPARMGGD